MALQHCPNGHELGIATERSSEYHDDSGLIDHRGYPPASRSSKVQAEAQSQVDKALPSPRVRKASRPLCQPKSSSQPSSQPSSRPGSRDLQMASSSLDMSAGSAHPEMSPRPPPTPPTRPPRPPQAGRTTGSLQAEMLRSTVGSPPTAGSGTPVPTASNTSAAASLVSAASSSSTRAPSPARSTPPALANGSQPSSADGSRRGGSGGQSRDNDRRDDLGVLSAPVHWKWQPQERERELRQRGMGAGHLSGRRSNLARIREIQERAAASAGGPDQVAA
eukprot:gnl/TRDRNA2_/TRDRNA2_193292_c0_seq1.p1 gnl/TRDRNA2_/TRDRNA2_193292_c0~~gnl/TRDRNA2_/TRDRNA2_193292_c0_seq1.p1  ORF type:complete len:277 (-),score=44.29 gnl/TRDRNA2_/TRDRNA2_193292_c0_seq1:70-900(-)